jgi:putative tricarboxylic transport membrane protein
LKGGIVKLERMLMGGVLLCAGVTGWAQGWSPQKNVEIIATSVPGGSQDKTARALERIFLAHKLVPSTLTVANRSGGGGNIAFTYVSQRTADPHYLVIAGTGLLSNHILGASKLHHTDLTPLAHLVNDYMVVAVSAGSPIRTGKEFVERLKKDPQSLSIGFANAFGSTRHISAGLLMKAIGANPRDLKTVVFKGSAEAIVAVLGGHIDVVVVGATNTTVHVEGGKMRVIGAGAPQRFKGVLAGAPTWKEQGVDLVSGTFRGIMGPKGLTSAQVAFWEGALRKLSETDEWKKDLERNYWFNDFMPAAQFAKELEKEYVDTKAVLVDLGLAKQ